MPSFYMLISDTKRANSLHQIFNISPSGELDFVTEIPEPTLAAGESFDGYPLVVTATDILLLNQGEPKI